MKFDALDIFLEHRRQQQSWHHNKVSGTDPMDSLVTVEMNITELCNRKCVFCPRADETVFPNRKLNMDVAVSAKVASDLASIGYQGRISFTGWGESLLNKKFADHIQVFRVHLPENTIETNTNGDKLNPERIRTLYASGLTYLYVNMYDGPEQMQKFSDMFQEAGIRKERFRLRCRWSGPDDKFGITMNNRGGILNRPELGHTPLRDPLRQKCYYPFFKMFVDFDGTVFFCSNDWGRTTPIGNVMQASVRDLWLSPKLKQIRERLSGSDRSVHPCSACDVNGMLHGKHSFDILTKYYGIAPVED